MTLEQLEDEVWPEPEYPSHVIKTCHRLRKKRLGDFCVEELRTMLGQSIGTRYLLPKAIEILEENAFACGDFFEGDLLAAIARHPENSSLMAPEYRERLISICRAAIGSPSPALSKDEFSAIENLLLALEAQAQL